MNSDTFGSVAFQLVVFIGIIVAFHSGAVEMAWQWLMALHVGG